MTHAESVQFPRLLSPIQIGTVNLRNRLVFQPHFTGLTGDDSMPNDALRAYFVERAMGGAGLIVDGHMTVMVEGMMAPHYIKAWEEGFIPGYRAIVDEVHAHGAKIFGQVTHAGHTSLTEPPQVLWAPTQMPEPSSHHTTRAMDLDDIRKTVKGFRDAARNIIATGADGIEVKIAHDGLLRSFASPYFNQRTDAYGGTFEKRMRLALEVLGGIREETGSQVPVGIRLCLHEYTPFGYGLEYGLRMAETFEATGVVDYFNSDAGTFSSFWMEIPPAAVEQGFFRPLNRELKKQSSLPVIAFGRIKQPDMAERMLELGEADLIGMARPLIADPELPRKLAENRAEEIRACIACNACIHQVVQVKGVRCVQNPGAGQERLYAERLVVKAKVSRHVVVVGGGPAGLKAAEIAARRGHRVTLLERSSELGGLVRLAARQPFHEEVAEVTTYLESTVERLGVEVWLNAEADADGLLELQPDVIVVATGSQPDLPPGRGVVHTDADGRTLALERGLQVRNRLRGLDGGNIRSTDEVLAGPDLPVGTRVLVIDAHGQWDAAGTAEYLADRGCVVEIVTARPEPGFGLEATNRALFLQRARAKGIRMTPLTEVMAIDGVGVTVVEVLNGTERRIEPVDIVVPVWPRASRDDLYFQLMDRLERGEGHKPDVLRVGDASAPRLIQTVLLEAHQKAMVI